MIDGPRLLKDGVVGVSWCWVGHRCWRTELESSRWVALKNKTTKLDKDHLIWIISVPNKIL